MLRVCITIIAYIISFLSHSGELSDAPKQDAPGVGSTGVEQLASVDTLLVKREFETEMAK